MGSRASFAGRRQGSPFTGIGPVFMKELADHLSSVRMMVLTLFVIPIAIVGNILRIMTLVLLTYFFGDAVAQGFAHFTAGIFLFAIALVLVFLTDNLLARILPKSWQEAT